jgi:hypothetical protein
LAGISFHKKLSKALLQEKEHEEAFQRFSELQLDDVSDWLEMVTAWERDHTQPNPYVVIKSGLNIHILPLKCLLSLPLRTQVSPKPTLSYYWPRRRLSWLRTVLSH